MRLVSYHYCICKVCDSGGVDTIELLVTGHFQIPFVNF